MSEIQHRQNKVLVVVIAAIAATGGLLFGFDTGVISGALPFLKDAKGWALDNRLTEWITTAVLIGAVLGAACSGRLTDIFGRKKVIIFTAFIFGLGAVGTAFAPDHKWLFIGRIIVGVAIGVASFSVPLYISEISPTKNRGALVSLNQLMITIGIFVSYISDYVIADNNNPDSWRWMFLVGFFPALILFIGMIFLPETPRWLIGKGKEEKGREVLKKVEDPELVEDAIKKIQAELALETQSASSATEIFKPWLRPALLIGITIMFFQQFTGINTIIYYSPLIFQKAGFITNEASIAPAIIIGAVNVFFTVVSIFLIDRLGRRPLYFIGLVGMCLSLVGLGLSFHFENTLNEALKMYTLYGMSPLQIFTVGCMVLYIVFFALSLGPIAWLIISEIYPLKIRGVGMSIGSLSNWLFNGIVAFTFLKLIDAMTIAGAFWLYAGMGVLGIIWGYYYLPETKGITLERIEEHWRTGKSPRELR